MYLKKYVRLGYSYFYDISITALEKGYRRIGCKRLKEFPVHQDESVLLSQTEKYFPTKCPKMSGQSSQVSSPTSYLISSPITLKSILKENKYSTLRYLIKQIKKAGLEEEFLKSSIIGLYENSKEKKRK